MDTAAVSVPIVDFGRCAVGRSDDQIVQRDIDQIASELIEAFSSAGFVYLKNCGISDQDVSEVNQVCALFFTLPVDTKKLYAGAGGRHGWKSLERENVNPERTSDLKESYDVWPCYAKNWPDKDAPGFHVTMMGFYEKCSLLALRVLKAIAVGLQLEPSGSEISFDVKEGLVSIGESNNKGGVKDTDMFGNAHDFKNGATSFRALYYPGLQHGRPIEMKPNQVRCGEHTDYGSITLLFQDDVGGLQVQNKAGEFIPVPPIPDTVVINVADLMQRWTSDRLVSTVGRFSRLPGLEVFDFPSVLIHRVMLPDDVGRRYEARQSLAFFAHPNRDYLIKSLGDTQKYEPIAAGDYLKQRIDAIYLH